MTRLIALTEIPNEKAAIIINAVIVVLVTLKTFIRRPFFWK